MHSPILAISPLLLCKKQTYFGCRKKSDPCRAFKRVNHCIFDLDGTILENQCDLDEIFRTVFERYGQVYTPEWRLKVMGMTGKAMWQKVIKELRLKIEWQNMYNEYRQLVAKKLVNAPLRPGVQRLIDHLAKHRVPMAIATSSKRASMEAKTEHIQDLMSKFSHVVCGGDDPHVRNSKPFGDIYTICAIRFSGKPDPQNCLVFEDSPIGVTAALNACMQVIGVPCPPTPAHSLRFADEVVNTLNDFWPGKYGMPPFPGQK